MQTLINFLDSFANLIVAVGVVVNLYFTYRSSRKIDAVKAEVAVVQETAEKTHLATNSMKDELVKEVREASLAKGVLKGREEVQAEQKV